MPQKTHASIPLDSVLPTNSAEDPEFFMAKPRKEIFNPRKINVLHIVSRCALQRWLFGIQDGKDNSHRRVWLEKLLEGAARIFAMDIGFFVEMSNHFHLILRNRPDIVDTWSDDEVVRRWVQASYLTRNKQGEVIDPTEAQIKKEQARCAANPRRIRKLRRRLGDPSSFMKCINENLALRVNREEGTKGHLFDERFDCAVLLGEGAILAAAIYVELNQIHAGEVETLEQSSFTSMYRRLQTFLKGLSGTGEEVPAAQLEELLNAWAEAAQAKGTDGTSLPDQIAAAQQLDGAAAFLSPVPLTEGLQADVRSGNTSSDPARVSDKGWLPFSFLEFLSLADWVARARREDKPGATPSHLSPILVRLGLRPENFVSLVANFRKMFKTAIGTAAQLSQRAKKQGRRAAGMASARMAFAN